MAETSLNYFNFRRQIVDDSLEFRRNPRIREMNRKKGKEEKKTREINRSLLLISRNCANTFTFRSPFSENLPNNSTRSLLTI